MCGLQAKVSVGKPEMYLSSPVLRPEIIDKQDTWPTPLVSHGVLKLLGWMKMLWQAARAKSAWRSGGMPEIRTGVPGGECDSLEQLVRTLGFVPARPRGSELPLGNQQLGLAPAQHARGLLLSPPTRGPGISKSARCEHLEERALYPRYKLELR